jgi:hypothetical protein
MLDYNSANYGHQKTRQKVASDPKTPTSLPKLLPRSFPIKPITNQVSYDITTEEQKPENKKGHKSNTLTVLR